MKYKTIARNTDFSGSTLDDCDMSYGDYRGSNFSRCSAKRTKFTGSNLRGCNTVKMLIDGESLIGVDTRMVNLKGSIIDGEEVKKQPIVINGLPWFVLITDNYMRLGCERHTHQDWKNMKIKDMEKIGEIAVYIFQKYSSLLFTLCDLHSNTAIPTGVMQCQPNCNVSN